MRLLRLELKGFRQFLNEEDVEFASEDDRNVTIVHAENGFGKTALLNALLWAFYGNPGLNKDFEKQDRLLNETLAAGGDTSEEAWVQVEFEDGGAHYSVCRSLSLAKQRDNHKKTDLRMEQLQNGEWVPIEDAQDRIHEMLPPDLSEHLFFNGERIDHLALPERADDITQAIYDMLGLNLLKRTVEDLNHQNVRGKLLQEMRAGADDRTTELMDRDERLKREREELERKLKNCLAEQQSAQREIAEIDQHLAAHRETMELQEERSGLEADLAEVDSAADKAKAATRRLIAEEGYALLIDELMEAAQDVAADLRQRQLIPARVLKDYIEDLLRTGTCICGCALEEGSEALRRVQAQLETSADPDFNKAVSAYDQAIGHLDGLPEQTRARLADLSEQRDDLEQQRNRIQRRLDEIHDQIGEESGETIAGLEGKRQEWLEKRDAQKVAEGGFREAIDRKKQEIEALDRQINESKQKDDAADLARRRLRLLDDASKTLDDILRIEMASLRRALNEEIRTHFDHIIDRKYWAELTEDFVLQIRKEVPGQEGSEIVAQSTGQRQVTSLVFIASLVSLARKRRDRPAILPEVEGGIFPLVMDSPFGQLGKEFRRGVAKWIPGLAPQVILMVSSTQYEGEVEEEIEPRVGKRYFLRYHGPRSEGSQRPSIRVAGAARTIYEESDIEYTEIQEVDT